MPLLIDTCAAIWIAEDEPSAGGAVEALEAVAGDGTPVLLSPMSGWEIGMLVARKRPTIAMAPEAWRQRRLAASGVALACGGAQRRRFSLASQCNNRRDTSRDASCCTKCPAPGTVNSV